MNENKTLSILHRLPVVLAVTAASYGLNIGQAQAGNGHTNQPRAHTQTVAKRAA
ncbi:hypothetical protein ACFPOE_09670 [Caenimonas terrae]|uniref:Uncharacterized protein n=1 Tax=Caenimonas terrae TaxID=696074 RepID=A0ABW0NEU8_9BURK